jgi:hypothetical protein
VDHSADPVDVPPAQRPQFAETQAGEGGDGEDRRVLGIAGVSRLLAYVGRGKKRIDLGRRMIAKGWAKIFIVGKSSAVYARTAEPSGALERAVSVSGLSAVAAFTSLSSCPAEFATRRAAT